MTKDEAKIYFQDCSFDLDDCYREKLFSFKQFFTTRPVISKVFKAKLEKLDKLIEAYSVLAEKVGSNEEPFSFDAPSFNDNLLDTFNLYYEAKNGLKESIFAARSGMQVSEGVQALLELERSLANHVTSYYELNDPDIKLSSEQDPMSILRDLKAMKEIGINSFVDIDFNSLTNSVTEEIKRLHLWRQY